ncbi:MAG: ribbon-helix-helix domain-containing protein [Alphaproteobacteria bacterium]|jgi:predicted DNA-binding ribbon-helix-helix protein|nr:ribbon-helix-helix domain-containing protein [Alphaproteobacteria bacterium]
MPKRTRLLEKRSVSIAGHRTSVALEPEFWAILKCEAARQRLTFAALVAAIDRDRGARPLASALRLHALAAAQANS